MFFDKGPIHSKAEYFQKNSKSSIETFGVKAAESGKQLNFPNYLEYILPRVVSIIIIQTISFCPSPPM